MTDGSEPIATYAFTPRPFGRQIGFKLFADRLEVDDVRRVTNVPLAGIELARLTFEPRGVFTRGFRCKLISAGRRSTSFTNLSWRSMVQSDDQRETYGAFLAALLPAIASANPDCRFVAGKPMIVWLALATMSIALLGGVITVAASAAPRMGLGASVVTLAFTLAFGWVVVEMVARNQPRGFRPDAPPRDLLK